ncbi:MAG: glycosyltransferase [Pseudomonadota bacterium]
MKPEILVLSTSYPSDESDPSSVFLARLLSAIKRRGYRITLVAPSDGSFFGRRVVGGVDTVRFAYFWPKSMTMLTKSGGGVPENLRTSTLARLQLVPMMVVFTVTAWLAGRSAGVIYANWLGAGIVGALLNVAGGTPLVVSFRGDDGYLARDRPLWRTLTRWVSSRSAVIAPVSEEIKRILVGLGVPESKFSLPRFGVDLDMFHPPAATAAKPNDSPVTILFVGSLIPRKGLRDLLSALAHPSLASTRLDVVGDGMDRRELMALCRDLGLEGGTVWHGTLPPRDVARLMREADIFCLPSYMEGKPNVVREAMASGLPVVASRVGGVPEMTSEGETAIIFDAGDVEALRNALVRLVSDPDLRRKIGTAGYRRMAGSALTWDVTAEDFDTIFSNLS